MSAPPRHPVTADQIRPGDPYEISEGRLVELMPTGQRGARSNLVGGGVLETDPAVEAAGVDLGVSTRPDMLRAPDIAVGPIADAPGWAAAAPPLAVEYADRGQDEAELQRKIAELLAAGTRWIWVVRLQGIRRVEVYAAAPDEALGEAKAPAAQARARPPKAHPPVHVAYAGEELQAPGVLKNPVPVDALYDRDAAHEATLRNLLQRKGYAGLDAVLEAGRLEGRNEGRLEALRGGVRDLCELLGITLPPEREAALAAMDEAAVLALRDHLKRERRWP